MLETGTVVEATERRTKVRLEPTDSCDVCGCKGTCAGSRGKTFVVDADNPCRAETGDTVNVEMTPVPVWVSIIFVFVAPVLLMLAGLGIGRSLGGTDAVAAIAALAGFALGFALLAIVNRLYAARTEYRPTVVRVVGDRGGHKH